MSELDRALLRTLADWETSGCPVTSVYLSVDGRRRPRRSDYGVRLDELIRGARGAVRSLDRDAARSVEADLAAVDSFVRGRFERGATRGLAFFSAASAGLWEELRLPRPVRDRAVVAPQADLLPLEALLETYESLCVAVVDYEKARLLIVELGRIEEESGVWDEVPSRHEKGGWAQARFQRHVDDHRQKHLKHVAEVLFGLLKRRPFSHLVLAGSDEAVADLERELHDYLRQRVRARIHVPIAAPAEEVLGRALAIEEELERERERAKVERLAEAASAGGRAVAGLSGTLAALAESRVGELVVAIDLAIPGMACRSCGRLAQDGAVCRACGAGLERVPDVVEAAVAQAFRQECRVETVTEEGALAELGGIGALLRF